MFHRAIVGIDGREGGRDAIALACALRPDELDLVAAYQADRVPTRGALRGFEDRLCDDAIRRLHTAERDVPADRVVRLYPLGDASPAHALQHAAVLHGGDLIVVGSSRRGVAGRLLVGDVSCTVLHDAPCPVAVAPRCHRTEARPVSGVVVGFDGSRESMEAVEVGGRLRDELEARLLIVEAVLPPLRWEDTALPDIDWKGVADEQRRESQRGMAEALERIGGEADLRTCLGDPGSVLVSVADDSHADLLVVGSRGWGTRRRVVLGSTSEYLIHRARCPVVVVPRPVAETTQREHSGAAGATA